MLIRGGYIRVGFSRTNLQLSVSQTPGERPIEACKALENVSGHLELHEVLLDFVDR